MQFVDLTEAEILKIYKDLYNNSTTCAKAMGISPIEYAHLIIEEFKKKNQSIVNQDNVNY